MVESDLFEPYDKLIEIEVEGRNLSVPENNRLLRCFQFVSMRAISYGDFCWNGDCTNCQFWYREPGQQASDPDKTALACRFRVREGLRITRLDPCIRLDPADKEAAPRDSDAAHALNDEAAAPILKTENSKLKTL